ncbi:Sap, sulfolipid-1-addressing protein [Natronorubrum sediminis]|uniref:Sap, sulfolipid-1-addressing protein n=1 Tax=Natronorubrum sediminis TaxID=640943 RepID=A0A1H6FMI2_9EURY|nr:GAP family protein [Natronorubrum sediminis]SEH12107.1 Sap, sulfolipid-1-addressing protein [Natronorubrum sediminis]
MNFLVILPLVFVMIGGPQILSAIFLATSEDWRRNSAAFVFGASLSISLVVTLAYYFGSGVRQGGSNRMLQLLVLVVLLAAMVHVYLKREQSEPPTWMGKLESANPKFSFQLGFLLMGFFPTDVLTSITVGTYLASHGDPLWYATGFVLLTLLFLALPSLSLVMIGDRAETLLPKVRTWMNTHSWIVSEIVILIFVAITINNIVG